MHLAGEEVEAVVDTGASASVVGKCQTRKLGISKKVRKVKVRQRDRSCLAGNFVVNALFQVMDSSLVLGKFAMDAEVLYIRKRDIMLWLDRKWILSEYIGQALEEC